MQLPPDVWRLIANNLSTRCWVKAKGACRAMQDAPLDSIGTIDTSDIDSIEWAAEHWEGVQRLQLAMSVGPGHDSRLLRILERGSWRLGALQELHVRLITHGWDPYGHPTMPPKHATVPMRVGIQLLLHRATGLQRLRLSLCSPLHLPVLPNLAHVLLELGDVLLGERMQDTKHADRVQSLFNCLGALPALTTLSLSMIDSSDIGVKETTTSCVRPWT